MKAAHATTNSCRKLCSGRQGDIPAGMITLFVAKATPSKVMIFA